MPYSISQMIVDADQNVVALDWAYTNPDGDLYITLNPISSKPDKQIITINL